MPQANDLWSFARAFYAEPGVAEACLSLQDTAGADVCIVLHLLHFATTGRTVSAAAVVEIDAAARPWREAVVIPLRTVRRALRQQQAGYPEAATVRKSVAALEIEAEMMQLAFLEAIGNREAGLGNGDDSALAPHGESFSAPSWPGLSRPSAHERAGADGRDRPGHDGEGGEHAPIVTARSNLAAYRDLLNQPPETTTRLLKYFEKYITRPRKNEISA